MRRSARIPAEATDRLRFRKGRKPMASPKYPAVMAPKGSLIAGNDDRHNLADDNQGGSPRGGAGTKRVALAQRGGVGHQGRDRVHQRAQMPAGRGSRGNPAARGGTPVHMRPDQRVPGHGGSPQKRGNIPAPRGGGFGRHGQENVPQYPHSQPKPSAGNTSGRSYQLISGRFKRKAMGAKPSGDSGKYGSPPVSSNT